MGSKDKKNAQRGRGQGKSMDDLKAQVRGLEKLAEDAQAILLEMARKDTPHPIDPSMLEALRATICDLCRTIGHTVEGPALQAHSLDVTQSHLKMAEELAARAQAINDQLKLQFTLQGEDPSSEIERLWRQIVAAREREKLAQDRVAWLQARISQLRGGVATTQQIGANSSGVASTS
eukprot:comp5031_c0_seq1/m.1128 comp5031_c0_seq1/g.1128  ORF comp5031_c0_seq1/g.1128 comp5031_c0_seq1/m.1128 type:complete len:177 (-) comp5031_c0_seq1:4-534(-)